MKFKANSVCQSLFLIKVQALGPDIKRPWHRCFPVNFAKFLRTSFLTEHLRWLLLSKIWLALQFSIFCVCSFIEDFLLISFQQKNEIKKGKYPDSVQIFTFFSSIDLFDIVVFMVRGISLVNGFWVVKTWRTPVRKRLKQSTLNFAHTFLTDCCTKPCPRFI